jgi:hypothetical protein
VHSALLLLAVVLAAAEPPPVPDPVGLGERLALIDHLREVYGQKPAPGVSLEELQSQYAAAWAARSASSDDDPGAAERQRRLRGLILARHGIESDPTLSETGLQDLLHRLDEERTQRDQAAIAAKDAAERAGPRSVPAEETPASAIPPPAAPAASAPVRVTAAPAPGIRPLAFTASGVTQCLIATAGERSVLLVTFGTDHNGAFTGIREGVWSILSQAPAIRRGVLLLGHGAGSSIASESIAQHLARNKLFYETMGGTAPAAPVQCLVFAACAGGGQGQMGAMRDGLGYFPTWRVATGDDASTTALNVLAALQAIAGRPAKPSWRGMFRLRSGSADIVSFGDVGEEGDRAETTFWRIVKGEAGWTVEEQR